MIEILTWTSIFAGGILILLFLVSLLGGLDLDIDLESDTDAGGLGLVKGVLTFVSVASWVIKILLVGNSHPAMAITVGVISGIMAFMLLSYLFKALLRNEENVNWLMSDAMFENGDVYLKIPAKGTGIVNINVKGANRELKAKSKNGKEIETGAKVMVVSIEGEYAVVEKSN